MQPRQLGNIFKARAGTNAALHRYQDAYADLSEFQRRYSAEVTADRLKQAATLRARFETDREIERNESLRRELSVAQQRSDRQREQLRWIAFTSAASLVALTLLTYILLASLRHRRQLVRLATIDGLTGIPNRRRTAELATEALESALARQRPLTLALIDLDRFKSINDRCGHATGDHVLQEFARLSQQSIRSSDILGRWGGEEFLLVLSDTTIDVALLIVERLRSLSTRIELPLAGAGLRVSISAGLAANADGVRSLDDLIARADSALYQAKNQGRDLVRVAEYGPRAEAAPRGAPPLDFMEA
jgi:diguanylate cyclase (GGDEF)-like protein